MRRTLTTLGASGIAVATASLLLTLTGTAPSSQRPFIATAHALTIAITIAVGLYAWHRQPNHRFGKLLVAAGFGWSLTTFAESDASFLYSLGRVSLWVVELVVLYLVLAFPSGRLTSRIDRALVASVLAIVGVLFLPTAFLVASYPAASPLSGCVTDCPANFFMLSDSTPAFVDPVRVVREILIVLVFAAVAARLAYRINDATRAVRLTIVPVLAAAILRLAAYCAFIVARRASPTSAVVDVFGWMLVVTLPGIALGFLAALLHRRIHVAEAMEKLAHDVIAHPGRKSLEAAVSKALEDPTLSVAHWVAGTPGHWIGSDGTTVDLRHLGLARAVTEITENGQPAVALVHDPALADQQGFVDAAAYLALVATENERLARRLKTSLQELESSRTRIVAAADLERRRIERDLHDGAQQRLVALRIKLELADELMDRDAPHTHKLLREVETEIDDALDDVRSLARGIYPSLLADQGLGEALRAATLRVPFPTTVQCSDARRYSPEVESAVYFACLEALQNAAKHAAGATAIRVSIAANDELRFDVADNGDGFDVDAVAPGQGLTNMRDRLAAVGGRLMVSSQPGHGTLVSGVVPPARNESRRERITGERQAPPTTHMRAVWRE